MDEDRELGYDIPDTDGKPPEILSEDASPEAEAAGNTERPDGQEEAGVPVWQAEGGQNMVRNPISQPGYGPVPRPEYRRTPHAQQYGQMGDQAYSRPRKQSNMALASLVMGIIGIVTSCCCYGGLIFGCLGILFALLSKVDDTMEGYAKGGLATSIIALVLALLVFVLLVALSIPYLLIGGEY